MVSFILPGNSATGGYNVDNSLRFDDGSSDYLSRTTSTPTSDKIGTYSFWFKRSHLGTVQNIFNNYIDASNYAFLRFDGADRLEFFSFNNPNYLSLRSAKLFRDTSAWYHIVLVVDTTQATSSDRIKFYVNGVEETSFTSTEYGTQNQVCNLFTSSASGNNRIGTDETNTYYIDGYMAEVVFIDGLALDATSFGEFDEDSPTIWKPKNVSGLTFGNNGFYLDFEDSGSLGNDAAGSNNFTVNNLTAIDQSTDTCTNNFAVMNSLDNYYANSTFSEGNLKIATVSGNAAYNPATFGLTQGKWYFEVKPTSSGDAQERNIIGISNQSPVSSGYDGSIVIGDGFGLRGNGIMWNGSSETSGWNSFDAGDIVSVAVDFDNGKFYTATNGTYGNSSNPSTGSNGYSFTVGTDAWFPGVNCRETSQTATFELNFGSAPYAISSGNADANGYGNFEYSVPSGFYSINSKNLAEFG